MNIQIESNQAETVPTRFVTANNGVSFAYRRFGKPNTTPLVFLQHFRGTLDNWDPALLNGFARDRTVITVDNAGVGLSSGVVPDNIAEMTSHIMAFFEALNLTQVDLLGFSLGGYIAQDLILRHPGLVRRLILAGTGPGKGEGTQNLNQEVFNAISGPSSKQGYLYFFFEHTDTSRAAGEAFWQRLQNRQGEPDPFLTGEGVQAQRTALTNWDLSKDQAYPHLGQIAQPVLVASGSNDLIIPTMNSIVLAQRLPNALLIIYPDSGHGFMFQHHTLFVEQATAFLNN